MDNVRIGDAMGIHEDIWGADEFGGVRALEERMYIWVSSRALDCTKHTGTIDL